MHVRGHFRHGLLVAACAGLCGGCSLLDPEHFFGLDESEHPWHQVPAKFGMALLGFPMVILAAPIWLTEAALGEPTFMMEGTCSVSKVVIGGARTSGA